MKGLIPAKQYAKLEDKVQAAATIAAGRLLNVHSDPSAVMLALAQVMVIVLRRTGQGADALDLLAVNVRDRLAVDKPKRRA